MKHKQIADGVIVQQSKEGIYWLMVGLPGSNDYSFMNLSNLPNCQTRVKFCSWAEYYLKDVPEDDGKIKVDLTKTDEYPDEIPDRDIEITLKVLRSIRNVAMNHKSFNADTIVILSHAHKCIADLIEDQITYEKEAEDNAESTEQ